jgi:dihydrofolate reductase
MFPASQQLSLGLGSPGKRETEIRKVTLGVACSLDNFIARKDHAVDWLFWSDDVTAIMRDYWKMIDTILMGRKTYEISLRSGSTDGYPGMKTIIISRTLMESPGEGVEIVAEGTGGFVGALKKQEGKDICLMGGGELAKSLFEAKVIDEVGLNIHPVLLGSGIPLYLEMRSQVDLELLECKKLQGGCVFFSYRVKK